MRLFIAEKPNMGRELARFLPGPHSRKDGYIETGGGYVTWCIGHILEQANPEDYDDRFKQWRLEDLPIMPDQWKMKPVDDKRKQVSVIRDLLKKCTSVVNAGDPGREGQLIVDEVLEFLGNKKPVERILLNALDKATVTKALNSMVDNRQFHDLYQAALGRSRADWLIGMNLTRAYSVLASQQGRRGVLSVGRVQSPTLAIVVRRDEEIENFKPQDYWSISALFVDPAQADLPFWARWLPSGVSIRDLEKADQGVDDDEPEEEEEDEEDSTTQESGSNPTWFLAPNRILDRTQAERIAAEIQAATDVQVARYENKPAKESAPLPFELAGLQAAMNSKYGASVQQTLDACQSLYEKGFASYPRTDCSYLPSSQHPDAASILATMADALPDIASLVQGADPSRQSRAFNDEKMGEHHAIIPTLEKPDLSQLTELERHIYRAISLNYLAQFYPDCLVDKATVEVKAGDHRLVAKGRVVKDPGWRVIFGSANQDDEKKKESAPTLPVLSQGQALKTREVKNQANQTKPPPRFTEGTLLKAMKHVDRLVEDPALKKKLKTVEGIGRSATRAGIIETLLKRGFISTQSKKLISTPIGRALVKIIPSDLTDPALTARWETILDAIASGQVQLTLFEERQRMWVQQLVDKARSTPLPPLPSSEATAGRSPGRTRRTSKTGSRTARGGKGAGSGKACPKCGKGVMRDREVRQGPHKGKKFKGCSNFPECKHSEWPK